MECFVVTRFYKNKLLGFLKKDDTFEQIFDLSNNDISDIYIGLIKDKVENLSSFFVEFGTTKGFCKVTSECFKKYKTGDKLLVQVKSEPKNNKLHTLTTDISYTGKYVVVFPADSFTKVSSKINDANRREELKNIGTFYDCGLIFRTQCNEADDLDIKNEIDSYLEMHQSILQKSEHISAKECLYKTDTIVQVCNNLNRDTEIVTDDSDCFEYLKSKGIHASLYSNNSVSLQNKYALGKVIKDSTSPKVWLKSGAYLVIESTEALTTIDVNSGKNISTKNAVDNHFSINREAISVILHQIKLRNISGIIIVDFINMSDTYREQIFHEMVKRSNSDNLIKIVGFTKLGLMEITRKKESKTLIEVLE